MTVQGLPADYLSINDKYVRASSSQMRSQSIEDIDRILIAAGLRPTQSSHTNGQTTGAATDAASNDPTPVATAAVPHQNGKGPSSGEDIEW